MNESSLNLFQKSLEGCQFNTARVCERVWLGDPPSYPNCRYLILISEDRLDKEIQNQLECWNSRISQTILVCCHSNQEENDMSVDAIESCEIGIYQSLCTCLPVQTHMNWSEFVFEVIDDNEMMKKVRLCD